MFYVRPVARDDLAALLALSERTGTGLTTLPAIAERLASCLDFWNDFGTKPIPAWANVEDNSLAPYAGSTGFRAIVELARGYGQPDPPPLPTNGDKDDYYSASLVLLAEIAQRETAH